ncbi:MAG: hypothetical protein MI810_03560 [Flavobacteriales bacterium]|jgi:hypothetical protein|nr:hypothetical protein [Flavobacteriales bacterium]
MSELDKKRVIRNAFSIVGGIIAGIIVTYAVERLSHSLYPPPKVPAGMSMDEMMAMYEGYLKIAPTGALLMIALAHFAGTFVGVLLAFRLQKEFKLAGIFVGIIILFFTLVNLFQISHPMWFAIVDVLAVLIGIIIPWRMLK